jgi:alpha-galactosidase
MRRSPTNALFTFVFVCISLSLTVLDASAAAVVVVSAGDASISNDRRAGTWLLTAGGTTLTLVFDGGRDFSVSSLKTESGASWTIGSGPDAFVRVGDDTLPFGKRAAGFTFRDASASAQGNRLQLDVRFDVVPAGIRLTRHYAIAGGSPTFETWTTYEPTGNEPKTISDLNSLQLTIPAGTIHWVNGLQGSASDVANDDAFTLQQRSLADGEGMTLGGAGRSSEQTVPWFAVDGAQDEFYAALMWSGAWTIDLNRTGAGISVSAGLGPMSTDLQGSIEGAHMLFGAVRGALPQATRALQAYVVDGLRSARPINPLVTYNTWYAYLTRFDSGTLRGEMSSAAALGAELFVVDAGWYAGSNDGGPADFTPGLGSWRPDSARFPDGLRPLADYAHSLGMRFGIWIEPERVSDSLVGRNGIEESWLAAQDGDHGSANSAQICLAADAARTWILGWLTALIDDVQPDYLKWDNNLWVNCNREGHGHGSEDGNFAHVNALYGILAALRDRYPNLLIENVSGGGNRLDFGMLRYTDVAWMDDRTTPSRHVRHDIQGLSVVFPPAYLLSFLTHYESEPLHDAPDMQLYIRSRMASALGLCFRSGDLSDSDSETIVREVDIYKGIRPAIASASATLLTPQAAMEDGPPWDVLQETAQGGGQVIVSAFQSDEGVERINVKPTGLAPDVDYDVESVDAGPLGTASGADLMGNGIDIVESPNTAAHILILTARQ